MKRAFLSAHFVLFSGLIFSVALPAIAATYNVTVGDSGFSPAALTIETGDTVVWENVDESDFPHTTTSNLPLLDPNYWNGLLAGLGDTFANTFNSPGVFTYFDQIGPGTGTITVNSSATPLIVLGSPRIENGQFLFEAAGLTVGKTNIVEASTNLVAWTAIQTNVAASTSLTFSNAATLPHRFFRLVELP